MTRRNRAAFAAFLGLAIAASATTALADVESARKYLAEAAKQVKDGDANKASMSLDLAEAELDGVPEADAAPLRKELEALKKELSGGAASAEKKKLAGEVESTIKRIKRWMDDGQFEQADTVAGELETALNDPANKKILGDDAATYLKQLAPLRKVATKRLLGDKVESLDGRIKVLEDEWPKTMDEILGKDTRSSQQYAIRSADDSLNRLETMLKQLPADDEAVKPLAARIEKMRAEYASAASAGTASAEIDRVASRVESVEGDWAELMKTVQDPERSGVADSAARDAYTKMEMLKGLIADLPADDPRTKALAERQNKMQAEFDKVYAAAGAARVVARLQDLWDDGKEGWQGWEDETAGPSFQDFALKGGSSGEQQFNMPKTVALRRQADRFFDFIKDDESYKAVAEVPEVKAIVDDVRAKREQAYAKLVKAATAVVAEAETAQMDSTKLMAVQYMDHPLQMALGEESPEYKQLLERRDVILKREADAVAAAEKAAKEAYAKLSAEAEKAWPAMAAKFADAQDGFDPDTAKVGQYVRLKDINNRMGWDYGSDDLPFASRWNGKPFAARFDPVIRDAFVAARKQIGNERITDNGWDMIAIVESGTVRITERVKSEVRDSGGSSLGSLERWNPIQVPVIRVVALRAGPVAAAVGAGAVNIEGKVEQPNAGASTGGATGHDAGGTTSGSATASLAAIAASPTAAGTVAGGRAGAWLWMLLTLAVGLTAAAAALLKAGYAPLAAIPQAGAVQARVGGEQLAMIGLACAAIGVVFLLRGYVVFGLLTNLAIIAAGAVAALDWLVARGVVKPELAARVSPLAVPIGLACAALVVVRLLSGLIGVNLYLI